jgi:hypothetical protein
MSLICFSETTEIMHWTCTEREGRPCKNILRELLAESEMGGALIQRRHCEAHRCLTPNLQNAIFKTFAHVDKPELY